METPAPKPSRWKKFLRRAVFVMAALFTLGALLIAEENWRGGRAWRSYKREMEAKGERFEPARLIPPKVPDDENFAACPVLINAYANTAATPGWSVMHTARPKSHQPPNRPGWPYGLSSDLTNWAVVFQGRTESEKMDPVHAAAIILDELKECEPDLALLRAASSRRYCRFNNSYENWNGSTSLNLEVLKWLFGVMSLHAEAELAAGRSDLALEDIQLMFRLDDGLKDEPLNISQMVRRALIAMVMTPIAEGLAERRWTNAQLRLLEERLGQTDLLASSVRGLYGERDLLGNPFFDRGAFPLLPKGWARLEQVNVNRGFQEYILARIDMAGRVIDPAVSHTYDLALSNYWQGGSFWNHKFFTRFMLELIEGVPRQAAGAQTDVDLVTVACALERYRLAEGTYPDQLAALVPRFIGTLPHDIINGQPLNYRFTPDGKFVLYSVGWRGKGIEGVVGTRKDGSPNRLQGDWSLEYPD